MRQLQLGKDKINLNKFQVVQLTQQVQNDGTNCGVYCLKVRIKLATMLLHIAI